MNVSSWNIDQMFDQPSSSQKPKNAKIKKKENTSTPERKERTRHLH